MTFLNDSWQLIKPYWCSQEKWSAIRRLIIILVFSTGLVRLQVYANDLVKSLYDAIQKFAVPAIAHYVLIYIALILVFAAGAAIQGYLFGVLCNRWRLWATHYFVHLWVSQRAYYKMQVTGHQVDNPDQRIADDIDNLTTVTLTLFVGLFTALFQLGTFTLLIWQLGGALTINIHEHTIVIPGYLFWCVLSYAAINTLITVLIGKQLSALNYQQQHYNANFRFGLMRLREYGEQVALLRGEQNEQNHLEQTYQPVFSNFLTILGVTRNLTFFTRSTDLFAAIIGILIALPIFVQTHATIGSLMQMSSMFGYEYDALSFLISSYTTIATWQAVVKRLTEFSGKITLASKAYQTSCQKAQHDHIITLEKVDLALPNGTLLQKQFSLQIKPGETVLITGPSGCGKSTVLKLIAGLWPFAHGALTIPDQDKMFLPQKPYIPPIRLSDAICFPAQATDFNETDIKKYLQELNLAELMPVLSTTENWHQQLSLGIQQKISIIRALLHKPRWLFLDEATASLDEYSETQAYQLLRKNLPATTIVSVGHRGSLRILHDRIIEMETL